MIPPFGCTRRKDPEGVRSALIESAARLIAREGLAKLTVEAVAREAGVTKGGLFHHFKSRQALIDGVAEAVLAVADADIDARMAADPEPQGAFTRASIMAVFSDETMLPGGVPSRALCRAMLSDPSLEMRFYSWREARIARHAATDDNTRCALARLAADGVWLASLIDPDRMPPIPPDVREAMIALTYHGP